MLIVHNGQLLLARRDAEPAKGQWDTVGGFVDAGESAEEAVVRETKEETGLHIRKLEYLGSVPDHYGSQQMPILHLCYLATIVDGDPVASSDVASLGWFCIDDIPDTLAFPNQSKVLGLLRDKMAQAGAFPQVLESL